MLSERACSNRMSDSSEEFDMDQEEADEGHLLEPSKPEPSKQGGFRDYSKDEKALNSKKMIYRTHDQHMFKEKKLSLPNSSTNLQTLNLKQKKSTAANHFSHTHISHKEDDADSETSLDFAHCIPMRTPDMLPKDLQPLDTCTACTDAADFEQIEEQNYLSVPPAADMQTCSPGSLLALHSGEDLPPAEESSDQPAAVLIDSPAQSLDQVLLRNPGMKQKSKPHELQSPKKKQLHPQHANMKSSRSQRIFLQSSAKAEPAELSHESEDDLPEGTPKNLQKQLTSDFHDHYLKPDFCEVRKTRTKKNLHDRSMNLGPSNKTYDQTQKRKLFEKDKAVVTSSNQTKSRFLDYSLQKILESNKDKPPTNRSVRNPIDTQRTLNFSQTDSKAVDSLASGDTASLQKTASIDPREKHSTAAPQQPSATQNRLEFYDIIEGPSRGLGIGIKLAARAQKQVFDDLLKILRGIGIEPYVEPGLMEYASARGRLKAKLEEALDDQQLRVTITLKPGNKSETQDFIDKISCEISHHFQRNWMQA